MMRKKPWKILSCDVSLKDALNQNDKRAGINVKIEIVTCVCFDESMGETRIIELETGDMN